MSRKSILILLGIIIFGFVIRLVKIQALPMYGDELTMVYDIYSISKTGMDSTGVRFPLTFKMGAGRPGGYIYFSLPFVYLFGPTLWGVRSLSLLSGLGIIALMYFLGKKLFSERVGFIGSLLAAISPWDIYLSRGGFEAHFALFLALLGITMFLYKKYVWWAIAWGICVLTYPTFKLTLPLIFIVLIWFIQHQAGGAGFTGYKKLIQNKLFVVGLIVLAVFGALVIREHFVNASEQRFLTENILGDQGLRKVIVQTVSEERTISSLPRKLQPIFINREIEYGRILFDNYVKNISPNFLILRGDGRPRHNPGEMGMIYLVDLPLIIVGLGLLWRKERDKFYFLLKWILITPLATMFFPDPHALRNGLMLPALLMLSAFALSKIPKKFVYFVSVLILIQLVYILVRIYTIAPKKFASFWSSDAKSTALMAIQKSNSGEAVVLSTEKVDNIEYAYEVYARLDPKLVISQYGQIPKKYGNVTIVND